MHVQIFRKKLILFWAIKKKKDLTVYRKEICIICQKFVFLYLPKYMIFW
jgi:hypothetical protein